MDRNSKKDQETLRKLNPLRQVPVFVGSDGFVLTECMAILLYRATPFPTLYRKPTDPLDSDLARARVVSPRQLT